jgi:hypothetical protein
MNRTLLLAFLASLFCVFSCTEVSPEITIPQDTYSIDADGGELSLQMSSNVSLALRPSVDWIKIVAVSDGSCLVRVSANPDYNSRTGSIVFTHAESSLSKEIYIQQGEQIGLVTKSDNYDLDYTGQTFSLPVSSNAELTVSVSADWIHPAKTKGLEEHTLSFQIDENLGKESRTAEILLSAGNKTRRVSVVQKATKSVPDTWEEIRESEKMASEVAQSVQTILASHSEDTPATTLAAEIEKLPQVISSSADQEGENIRLMKRDSTFTTVVLHPEKYGIDPTKLKATTNSKARPRAAEKPGLRSDKQPRQKVLLLAPYQSSYVVDNTDYGNRNIDYKSLKKQFNDLNISFNYYLDSDADLDKFRADTMAKYDLVLIRTHGGSWIFNKDQSYTVCSTGQNYQEFPEDFDPKLFSTLETEIMAHSSIHRYVITAAWLEATSQNIGFPSTIIYNGSCESNVNSDFSDFFTRKGAAAYSGFSDEVHYKYSNAVLYSLCRSFCMGMTVLDAFEYIKRDSELMTSEIRQCLTEYPCEFTWDVKENRRTIVDPTPFDLYGHQEGDKVSLNWSVRKSTGNYRYTVTVGEKEYPAGSNLSLSIPAGAPGQYGWTVRADLYMNNSWILNSYTSDQDYFTVTQTSPGFTVTTGAPSSLTDKGATFMVSYENKQGLYPLTGGIVYSISQREPAIGLSACIRSSVFVDSNPFKVTTGELNPSTKYYVRAYVITGTSPDTPASEQQVHYGEVVQFETQAPQGKTDSGIVFETEDFNKLTAIQFDNVEVGSTASLKFYMWNRSTHYVTVRLASIPDGFSLNMVHDREVALAPNEGISPTLFFSPTRVGPWPGTIIFDVGDSYYPVELPVTGYAVDSHVSVTGVSLDKTELTLTVEDQYTLHATVNPSDATNKNVSWKSLEPSVAKVENGVVTALSPGSARILVTTEDGGYTATCIVTVRAINGGHEGTGGDEWNL